MAETKNIVILGGSNAGLGVAHSLLKHYATSLKSPNTTYQLHLVEPSTHYWWRISAPRALISTPDMPHSKTFLSIADGFKQYPAGSVSIHQAKAVGVDPSSRTVTIESTVGDENGKKATIQYYALIIATGSSTPTPLTSLHDDHKVSIRALDAMNARLTTARSIVIGGGGPVAVETAGEIGDRLNGVAGWFKSRPDAPKAKITLVTSADKLLPILNKGQSAKAEKFLTRLGVDVIYGVKVVNAELSKADGEFVAEDEVNKKTQNTQSVIHLSNGEKVECDVYIPAVGATPNTDFLPKEWVNEKGFVKSTKQLRAATAGERVYVVGDAQDNTAGGMMSLQNAVPTVAANLVADLQATETKNKPKERDFTFTLGETQCVPIGRSKGVLSFNGYNLPSAAAWAAKGRDYMVWGAKGMVTGGKW